MVKSLLIKGIHQILDIPTVNQREFSSKTELLKQMSRLAGGNQPLDRVYSKNKKFHTQLRFN